MIIYHLDRNGKPWLFSMKCTRIQAGIFCRFLRTLGQVNPPRVSDFRRRSAAYGEAVRFCANLEQFVLAALSQQYAITPQDKEQADATGDYYGL